MWGLRAPLVYKMRRSSFSLSTPMVYKMRRPRLIPLLLSLLLLLCWMHFSSTPSPPTAVMEQAHPNAEHLAKIDALTTRLERETARYAQTVDRIAQRVNELKRCLEDTDDASVRYESPQDVTVAASSHARYRKRPRRAMENRVIWSALPLELRYRILKFRVYMQRMAYFRKMQDRLKRLLRFPVPSTPKPSEFGWMMHATMRLDVSEIHWTVAWSEDERYRYLSVFMQECTASNRCRMGWTASYVLFSGGEQREFTDSSDPVFGSERA
jgi:hypothetical protein